MVPSELIYGYMQSLCSHGQKFCVFLVCVLGHLLSTSLGLVHPQDIRPTPTTPTLEALTKHLLHAV